jgi:hypothetical protein
MSRVAKLNLQRLNLLPVLSVTLCCFARGGIQFLQGANVKTGVWAA